MHYQLLMQYSIKNFLNKLDTEKIIAQSYDGANVISGANEGI